MYRDRDEALQRLQEQLLSEEEEFTEEADEETPEEDESSEDGCAYQNFSNGYGKQPGYKAYNSDVTDTDLERYSEEVRQPKRSGCLGILAAGLLLLTAVSVAALLWWYWKRGGVL